MKKLLFITLGVLASCSSTYDDFSGLWQLERVNVDGLDRTFSPVLLEIKEDRSFSASKVSGDLVGTYFLKSDKLYLASDDTDWFNTSWTFTHYQEDVLDLSSPSKGLRNTKLRFRKIDHVPGFQEFEDKVVGKWDLYKMKGPIEIEKLSDTWFVIDNQNRYSIIGPDGTQEEGRVIIDTRHRKVIFETGEMAWNAWFYGKELRLTNNELDIQYFLRRIE